MAEENLKDVQPVEITFGVSHFRTMPMAHAVDHSENRQPIAFDVLVGGYMPAKNGLHMFPVNTAKDFPSSRR